VDGQAKFYRELEEKGFAINHEIKSYKKSGEIFEALFSGVVINLNGEQCVSGSKTDLTELRQYQREISRLNSLNLLITEFLSLAQNRPVDLKTQNFNFIIESLHPLIQADAMVAGKYVDLQLDRIENVLADGKEIRQLILNLVRNGFEAMSPGGTLTIKTHMIKNTVVLVIQDQGKGIDANAINKIGTPFFTTKDNGTGLGLATCYSIVARHNASIKFDTGTSGTTFYTSFNSC